MRQDLRVGIRKDGKMVRWIANWYLSSTKVRQVRLEPGAASIQTALLDKNLKDQILLSNIPSTAYMNIQLVTGADKSIPQCPGPSEYPRVLATRFLKLLLVPYSKNFTTRPSFSKQIYILLPYCQSSRRLVLTVTNCSTFDALIQSWNDIDLLSLFYSQFSFGPKEARRPSAK